MVTNSIRGEMMEYIHIYLIGWAIWSLALVAEITFNDIFSSFVVGAVWPIHLPAMLLKKLFRS